MSSRSDGIQLKRTLDQHLRRRKYNENLEIKVAHPNVVNQDANLLKKSTSETISLFSSLKYQRQTSSLPQYQNLLKFFQASDSKFAIIVHNIFPILVSDTRWDLVEFFAESLIWSEKQTDFGGLKGSILQKIFRNLNCPESLLQCAHVNKNWRKFAGKHSSWENLLLTAANDVNCLTKQVKIWRQQELSVDAEPLRYFNLYEMLIKHSEMIIQMREKKERKRKNLKKLN